jgi:TonB-dependent receptor-like protein
VDLFESRQVQTVEGGVKGSTGRLSYTVNGFYTRLKHIVSQGAVLDSATGATTWIIVTSPVNNAFGAEVELVATPVDGLQIFGNTTILKAELGTGAGADIGSRINGVPTSVSNLSAIYSPPSARGFQVKGDWHWVDKRPVDITTGNSLPAYSYFNFGASYTLPSGSTTISADLLNAFQNKGLEEGNPRIQTGGGSLLFNARPILPRRFTIGVLYNFGGLGAGQASGAGTGQ